MSATHPIRPPASQASILHSHRLARRLEGTLDREDAPPGIWHITAERVQFGWGRLTPSAFDGQPVNADGVPYPPANTAAHAAANRTTGYKRVWSADGCAEQVECGPVLVGLKVRADWLDNNGQLLTAATSSPVVGVHSVSVGVADRATRTLGLHIGSWGDRWGQDGFGRMTFDYFDQHLVEAFADAGRGQRLVPLDDHVYDTGLSTPSAPHSAIVIKRPGTTERLGWAMMTSRTDVVEVDDFYVRPEHRQRGLGRDLWRRVLAEAQLRSVPLRLWVPFADCDPAHLEFLRHFFGKRGYALLPSSRRSAGCEVRPGPMPATVPAVTIPDRPTLDRETAVESAIKLGLAVGPDGPPGWGELNRERAALIRKRRQGGLDAAEQARFERLQALADKVVEANLPPSLSDAERAFLIARDPRR